MNNDQTTADLIRAFQNTSTPLISDNLERLPGALGLRAFHKGGTMVGTALTVKTCAGDNLFIHKALELIQPGNVVIVDGGGDTSRALIGEIMVSVAKSRGAAGIVIFGAIRDSKMIWEMNFPCFANGSIHRGPYKNGPGQINIPVSIGGMIVRPGDIVVGDEDGLVAFPCEVAAELLDLVQAQALRENGLLNSIREGRYVSPYAKS